MRLTLGRVQGGKKETNIRQKLESSSIDVSGIARVAKKKLPSIQCDKQDWDSCDDGQKIKDMRILSNDIIPGLKTMVNGATAVANGIERLSREDSKSNSDYIAPLPEKNQRDFYIEIQINRCGQIEICHSTVCLYYIQYTKMYNIKIDNC